MTRALFLLGVACRLHRARRLAHAGRWREGHRLADRLVMELDRERMGRSAPRERHPDLFTKGGEA